jgi:uncharacterized protein YabN with tetrapyrrole methylase and pyrophosphatase domain
MHQPAPTGDAEAFRRLQEIVRTLRGEHGCPWVIRLTPSSLKKYLLEECRELAEAIDSGRDENICEEIGDVFFILTMLTAMFAEQERFTAEAALEGITAKMIRRHPHVFAGSTAGDEHHLRRQWERIKAEEKQEAAAKRSA